MKRKGYLLAVWIVLLVIIVFGCATSPFHQTPKEKCLASCEANLGDCKDGCEDSADFEPGAAQCVDQCEKTFLSCNEKCPK